MRHLYYRIIGGFTFHHTTSLLHDSPQHSWGISIFIYNYIDAGLLSVDNVDLPRKVRYRTHSHKKPVRVDKQCHVGRTYEDFEAYLAANPDIPVVEMDSVEGRKGGKVLLTIYFRNSSLMLAFIRDNNTAKSVTEIFDWLYKQLGHEVFTSLF